MTDNVIPVVYVSLLTAADIKKMCLCLVKS